MKKEFEFIMIFAEIKGLEQEGFVEVYHEVRHWLKEERERTGWDDDTIISNFMDEYNRNMDDMIRKYYETLWSCR